MTARQPWSGSDYDSWLDRELDKLDDEPVTQSALQQAVRDELDRLCKELSKNNPDPCDLRSFWLDIAAHANEGAELARIQSLN